MNTTIGKILENGTIEKQFHIQGYIYKDFEAFKNKTKQLCYVSEYDEDKIGENVGHTYKDFLEISQKFIDENEEVQNYCKENEKTAEDIAENLFEFCDWMHPSTVIEGWEVNGTYTE